MAAIRSRLAELLLPRTSPQRGPPQWPLPLTPRLEWRSLPGLDDDDLHAKAAQPRGRRGVAHRLKCETSMPSTPRMSGLPTRPPDGAHIDDTSTWRRRGRARPLPPLEEAGDDSPLRPGPLRASRSGLDRERPLIALAFVGRGPPTGRRSGAEKQVRTPAIVDARTTRRSITRRTRGLWRSVRPAQPDEVERRRGGMSGPPRTPLVARRARQAPRAAGVSVDAEPKTRLGCREQGSELAASQLGRQFL